jgi:hypothetical protein
LSLYSAKLSDYSTLLSLLASINEGGKEHAAKNLSIEFTTE